MTQQPVQAPSIDSILNGGGGEELPTLPLGPAQQWFRAANGEMVAKVPEKSPVGEFRGGRIVDFGPWPLTKEDENTGQRVPKLTKKGAQIWGIRVTVEIGGHKYNIWIEGTTFDDAKYRTKKHALILALKEAGASTIELGGELYMAWREQVDTGRPGNPATDWVARYVPAGRSQVNGLLGEATAPAAAPVATPVAVPAPVVPQQPVVPVVTQPAATVPAADKPPF